MSLPELYRKLLAEYEQLLGVTRTILAELKKGEGEQELDLLLKKKKRLGENIAGLTRQIASTPVGKDSHPGLAALTEVKDLLRRVTEKANLVQGAEERIQDFLQSKK